MKLCENLDDSPIGLSCIGVHGKLDEDTPIIINMIIIITEEGYITRCNQEPTWKKEKGKEHHLIFTTEPGEQQDEYLTHRTIPLKGSTGKILA